MALIGKSSSHVEEEEIDIPEFDPDAEVPSFTREPDPPIAVHEEPPPQQSRSISGPSFLGLTDSSTDETDYLLEEETPRRGRAGWIIFSTVAVIVLAVIGWIEWRAYQTGKVDIPFLKSSSGEQPKAAEEAANTAPADNAEPKSQAETSTNTSTPADASQSNPGLASTTTPETPPVESTPTKPEPVTQSPAAAAPATSTAKPSARPETTRIAPATPKPEAAKPKPEIVKPEIAKPADPRQNKMLLLGQNYLYGRGVPKSCSQALTYFQSAANENNAPAMSQLGAMYASGNCVSADRRAAYRWFVRAGNADPRNPWIQRNLNMLWRDMSSEERASVSNR